MITMDDKYRFKDFGLIPLQKHEHPLTPNIENKTMSIPGMPGVWDFGSEMRERPFAIPLGIIDYDRKELQRKLNAFVAFLLDSFGKPRPIKIAYDYAPEKFYYAKLNARLDPERLIHAGQFTLPLVAHDPYAYASANAYDPTEKYLYDVGFKYNYVTKADFVGKVAGSTVENPHVLKTLQASALQSPINALADASQTSYNNVAVLEGITATHFTSTNGAIQQHLFSFNLITHIERKYSFAIPGKTIAEKVAWLKANVTKFAFNWHGRGSGPSGNKASISMWNNNTLAWVTLNNYTGKAFSHTNSQITKIGGEFLDVSGWKNVYLDSGGFCHFLAYADPSNGTTASRIETDYVELEVTTTRGILEPDPNVQPKYFYDSGLMYHNTTDFDWIYSKHYSSVYNYSPYATALVIEIEGTVINPRITHQETGKTLYLPTIQGQKMTVEKFNVKVDGVNKFTEVHGIKDFHLMPGENPLLFEGGLPNAKVTYKWLHKFV